MRIVEQSSDRLVLDIRPIGLMVMCVGLFLLFLLLGFGWPILLPWMLSFLGTDVPGLAGMKAPGLHLLGYASIIPLLVAVFALKTRRLTLDRGAGTVALASRGVFGTRERSWPFAQFRGASLRRNRRSGNTSVTYTPVLELAGESVPVFPYGTSGSGPARLVETVNAWMGPQAGGMMTLQGEQAAEVVAALEKLGIKLPR